MSEKTESDEYEERRRGRRRPDLDVDHLIKDLETLKRRGPKVSDPAWRRLERLMEEKRTSEQLSDLTITTSASIAATARATGRKESASTEPSASPCAAPHEAA
jgi:hypothetical protein